jgi:hypothetical protein
MRRTLLLLLVALLPLQGCGTIVEPAEATLTMYVGPQQVDCQGMMPQKCLLVRFDPGEPWLWFYDAVQGFDFEPGFHYTLLVRRRTIRNPPQDSSSMEWFLIAVVSKEPAAAG